MFKIKINDSFYKYYSIILTIFLVCVGYLAYDYYGLNHKLANEMEDLKSKAVRLEEGARAQITTRAPEDTKPCSDWIGTNIPLAENDVCFYDGPKEVMTTSDIQVWSYSDKNWIEPVGTGDAAVPTIIKPNDTELGMYYPIVIKCPWGCTLGYTE